MTNFTLQKTIQKIFQPRVKYEPLIEVRIFKDAILHNLSAFQKAYPNLQFAPVLKSNAYGHGLVEVAGILDGEGLPFFMVDSFYEALVLRRAGIKTKILVLGYCREKQLLENSLKNASFGVIDLEILKNLSQKLSQPLSIHLKIDTGMHRQGILLEQIDEAVKLIKKNKSIILEGICSHLANADGENDVFTKGQIQKWNKIVEKFKTEFEGIKYFHLTNTAGTFYSRDISANVGRIGLGMYGINLGHPLPNPPHKGEGINTSSPPLVGGVRGGGKLDLKPALEMRSIITSIKHIPAGEKVGYNITYESKSPMVVATVPVGYTEGVDRRLSNIGYFKIADRFCPIVGRVSMNMSSIDISNISGINLEDKVVVISANPSEKNSVLNLAKLCNCTPYEILVHIPQSLRRVMV